MRIDVEDIKHGRWDGKEVWVCDYRLNVEPDKAPIRCIEPTRVLVVSSDTVNKKVYYSNSVFQAYGKSGKLTTKLIQLYDNTGYRAYTGVAVKVFTEYHECVNQWNQDVDNAVAVLKRYRQSIVDKIDDKILSLNNRRIVDADDE